jgi:O-6-methylguanine DNA methyltransferase
LAGAIDKPTAARAVGTAVGQNPLAYLIPCHRVIRETGVIGDYHWGPIRKRAIIAWESSRTGDGWRVSSDEKRRHAAHKSSLRLRNFA